MERVATDGMGEGNSAAQTGSLVHLGIQVYEVSANNRAKAIHSMEEAQRTMYKLADLKQAISMLDGYIQRAVSRPKGVVRHTEYIVTARIPCATFDPTGKEIVVQGTVDQVRELSDGTLEVIDFKSGRTSGPHMIEEYYLQLAGYTLGIAQKYKGRKITAYIGRLRDLTNNSEPYWWPLPFKVADLIRILAPVQIGIAAARAGLLPSTPGAACEYCPMPAFPLCYDVPLGRGQEAKTAIANKLAKQKQLPTPTSLKSLFDG